MIYNNLFLNRYNSFSGLKQAIKRAKGKFINPLVEIKEDWENKLVKYEKEGK